MHPVESIQKAANAARAGDTVLVQAGTYRESVTVKTSGLTLRGVGPRPVIVPPEKKSAPSTKGAICCVEGGKGVRVVGLRNKPVANVTVSDLKVPGFSSAGLCSLATDRLTVQRPGPRRTAGGTSRRSAGLIVIGDENKPRAGALTINGNQVLTTTSTAPGRLGCRSCRAWASCWPVTHDVVAGDSGWSSLSGGIVPFRSFVGAVNEKNRVDENWITANVPAGLVSRNAAKGSNLFRGNFRRVSIPAGLC